MKKYMEFLLENETVSGDTVQPEILFDDSKYNEINGLAKKLWNIVFTKRNLEFERDTSKQLKYKLSNIRYKPYYDKINTELKKKEENDTEESIRKEQEQKVNSAISGLINMKVPAKTATLIVKKINSEQPGLSLNDLISKSFREHGQQNQKTKQTTKKVTTNTPEVTTTLN